MQIVDPINVRMKSASLYTTSLIKIIAFYLLSRQNADSSCFEGFCDHVDIFLRFDKYLQRIAFSIVYVRTWTKFSRTILFVRMFLCNFENSHRKHFWHVPEIKFKHQKKIVSKIIADGHKHDDSVLILLKSWISEST